MCCTVPSNECPSRRKGDSTGRVLIVDDERDQLRLLKLATATMPYMVETATSAEEALALYRIAREEGHPFDLIVTDVLMPGGMSGLAMAEEIRGAGDTGTKIVVLTAEDSPMVDMRAAASETLEVWDKCATVGCDVSRKIAEALAQ